MTGSDRARPPRLALALLRFGLPSSIREAVLGDLIETFEARAARAGPAPARRWLWRECWTVWRSLAVLSDEPTSLTPPRPPMQGFWQDVRFAVRMFARRPGYPIVALLTLTLGIGATTAIFSVIKPVLLEALPYPGPGRLVMIWEQENDGARSNLGFATVADLRRESRTIATAAAVAGWNPTLLGSGDPLRLTGQRVGHQFFASLGVAPALGRDFQPEDDLPDVARVVILSHSLWRDRLGADPAVVGQPISLDGTAVTVVGVLPESFESLLNPTAQIWAPLRYGSQPWACRTCRHLRLVARLTPGTEPAQAQAELGTAMSRVIAANPSDYPVRGGIIVEPLETTLTRNSRVALLTLFGAVTLVLILACANVANLALGHAVQRKREFAVRMALGSGKHRLVRQLLLESTMLGLAGAVLAVAIAAGTVGILRQAATGQLARAAAIGLDWGVLGFAAAVGMAAGIGFGLVPTMVGLEGVDGGLRDGGRTTRRRGTRRALIVAEVTIAMALVAGAGLLVKSMGRLLRVNPGFEPERLLTADIQVAGQRFRTDSATWSYFRAVNETINRLPGVTRAALVNQLPLGGSQDGYGVHLVSRPRPNPADDPSADRYAVTPGYFETMAIPLVRGRLFTDADRAGGTPVIIINEALARTELAGLDPLGQQIRIGAPDATPYTVVGVVGDVRHGSLDKPGAGQIYIPSDQWFFADGQMIVVARTAGDPAALTAAVARAIRSIDAAPTIADVRPMTTVIGVSTAQRRMLLRLFEALAAVAMGLAAVGIFGVLSTGVAERSREFGIRSALGASSATLTRGVVAESLALGAVGIGLGLAIATLAARPFRGTLFEVAPTDPAVHAASALLIAALAVAAAWIPARRAARNDPLTALRSE